MGVPVKVLIEGQPVFLCCDGCKQQAFSKSKATLTKIAELKAAHSSATPKTEPPQANAPSPPAPLAATAGEDAEIQAALAKLSPTERSLAESQRFCAIANESRLGSMGPPVKVLIEGQAVFLCCAGCEGAAKQQPQETLAKATLLKKQWQPKGTIRPSPSTALAGQAVPISEEELAISQALAKLSLVDRRMADAQRYCPILADSRLGSMGVPVKLTLGGQTVFLCCAGCQKKALATEEATLKVVQALVSKYGRAAQP